MVAGSISVITGPMCSGKSEELLRRFRRYEIAGRVGYAFTSKKARTADSVACRGGDCVKATPIEEAYDALRIVDKETPVNQQAVVLFDEAQWIVGLMFASETLARSGHVVLVGGLDIDYQGNPFGEMAHVMAVADGGVAKLRAVCKRCGEMNATHTARLGDGDDAGGEWEPMCRHHWFEHFTGEAAKKGLTIYLPFVI